MCLTGCALGPARWFYIVVGTRKFGQAWVSTEGAKATAAGAAAISVTIFSAERLSPNRAADFRSAAVMAAAAVDTAAAAAAASVSAPAATVAAAVDSAVAAVAAEVSAAGVPAGCHPRSSA